MQITWMSLFLIENYKPEAVLNLALPYQDLTIMDACLKTGVNSYRYSEFMRQRIQRIKSGELYSEKDVRKKVPLFLILD